MKSQSQAPFRLPNVPRGPSWQSRLRNAVRFIRAVGSNIWFVGVIAGIVAIVIAAYVLHLGG